VCPSRGRGGVGDGGGGRARVVWTVLCGGRAVAASVSGLALAVAAATSS
jgi:hypothetical protein